MTELLDRPGARTPRDQEPATPAPRPLALGAALAALGTAGVVLLGCAVLALAGWFASDGGGHGTTRDALRVAADSWLLALGADLHLSGAVAVTISAMPLGLTAVCAYVAARFGAWAARTSAVGDLRTLLLGVFVMAGVHGLVALVVAMLASTATGQVGPVTSVVGGFLVALLGGGAGMLRARRDLVRWSERVPESVRTIVLGAAATVLLLFAAAAVLLAVSLAMDFGAAANVLSRLHTDVSGGLLYTAFVAAVAPNAVLLAASYLLGPGFAIGAGTVVSPGAVLLGPVPAFPLLAALPSAGTPPAWLAAVASVPVLAAVAAVVLVLRRHPADSWWSGGLRGAGVGVGGGLLTTLAIALAGGSVGPGRMADVGTGLLDTLAFSTVGMGVGGLVAGVVATWWARRR